MCKSIGIISRKPTPIQTRAQAQAQSAKWDWQRLWLSQANRRPFAGRICWPKVRNRPTSILIMPGNDFIYLFHAAFEPKSESTRADPATSPKVKPEGCQIFSFSNIKMFWWIVSIEWGWSGNERFFEIREKVFPIGHKLRSNREIISELSGKLIYAKWGKLLEMQKVAQSIRKQLLNHWN